MDRGLNLAAMHKAPILILLLALGACNAITQPARCN